MLSKPTTYLLVLLAFCTGCDPSRFSVLSDQDISCRIYSDYRLVDKQPSGFTLQPGACVSTYYLWATQYRAGYRLTLEEGEGVVIMFRPIVEEQLLDSGMVLTLGKSGYRLVNHDTVLATGTHPRLIPGKSELFRAYSDEGYLELTLGCDTLYKGITKRIEGDDIIFSTLPQSTVNVFAPTWNDLELDLLYTRARVETK